MRILVVILKADPKSEVRMPDAAKIALFKEAIAAKHSLLVDCYCMVDGLKLYLQQYGDSVIQSRIGSFPELCIFLHLVVLHFICITFAFHLHFA